MNRPKFPTSEPIPEPIREWMERMLIALGQMKHPPRVTQEKVMILELSSDERRELVHNGHVMLGYPGFTTKAE